MDKLSGNRARWTCTATLALAIVTTTPLQAADCKGKSETQCKEATSCTWVPAYTTKKGKTVEAYCRNKSSRSSKKEDKTGRSKENSAKEEVKQ